MLDPDEIIARAEELQLAETYDDEMARVEQEYGVDPELLHPFVAAADGDFDLAASTFQNYTAGFVDGPNVAGDCAEQVHAEISAPATIAEAVDQLVRSGD